MIVHSKPYLAESELKEAQACLSSNVFAKASKVKQFETVFANALDCPLAVATTCGKASLILALKVLGIEKGDEVILPTYVCSSVLNCIVALEAVPVILDVSTGFTLEVEQVKAALSEKTKVIIAVHTYGFSCDLLALKQATSERAQEIAIIADCAHSLGEHTVSAKQNIGADISIYSFQATKMMATGEGGMMVIQDERLLNAYERVKPLWSCLTMMSDLQASIGLVQFERLASFVEKRCQLAKFYSRELKAIFKGAISLPYEQHSQPVVFRYIIQGQFNFDLLREKMQSKGVLVRRGVDQLLHKESENEYFPTAQALFHTSVSLPIHPSMDISDCQHVVNSLREILDT